MKGNEMTKEPGFQGLVVGAIVLAGIILTCTGCSTGSSDDADAEQQRATSQAMKEAQAQIGMPAVTNFQERKLAKMIFELRDREDLVCYAYIVNKMQGKLVFIGRCIGFGLPYSVQYTNPNKLVDLTNDGKYTRYIMPQADPNGLFMPSGLSATWLMMIDPKTNEARPVYLEPEIVVSPFALH